MNALTGNHLLSPTQFSIPTNYYCHLKYATFLNTTRNPRKGTKLLAQLDDSKQPKSTDEQLNLSVLRFTFGISWLDETYLPRWIGYGFGSLIIVNHFVGSNSPISSSQLISEVLGLSLAAFSITLPFVGKFLKGSTQGEVTTIPENAQQIFVMSQNVADALKEDLAWASYILLRNTKSISVLISLQDVLCVRGYWKTPENMEKDEILYWFKDQIKKFGLVDVGDSLYFPQNNGLVLDEAVPDGIGSILIQPFYCSSRPMVTQKQNSAGFILLASGVNYAYGDKETLWIRAIANKFGGAHAANQI